jgi:hypothetical protein
MLSQIAAELPGTSGGDTTKRDPRLPFAAKPVDRGASAPRSRPLQVSVSGNVSLGVFPDSRGWIEPEKLERRSDRSSEPSLIGRKADWPPTPADRAEQFDTPQHFQPHPPALKPIPCGPDDPTVPHQRIPQAAAILQASQPGRFPLVIALSRSVVLRLRLTALPIPFVVPCRMVAFQHRVTVHGPGTGSIFPQFFKRHPMCSNSTAEQLPGNLCLSPFLGRERLPTQTTGNGTRCTTTTDAGAIHTHTSGSDGLMAVRTRKSPVRSFSNRVLPSVDSTTFSACVSSAFGSSSSIISGSRSSL